MTGSPAAELGSPALIVPESRLFGPVTGVLSAWAPTRLTVVSPREEIAPLSLAIRVERGSSDTLGVRVSGRDDAVRGGTRARLKRIRNRRPEPSGPEPTIPTDTLLLDTRTSEMWAANNVAHALANVVGLTLALREHGLDPTLVVRPGTARYILDLYEGLQIERVVTDAVVDGTWVTGSIDNEQFQLWKTARFGVGLDAERAVVPTDAGARVFLARRGERALGNHDEIRDHLEARGYRTVFAEDHSVVEQWGICRAATHVVAVHGAAMANLGFCRPGTAVVELAHAGYFPRLYRRCMAALGCRWAGVFSRPPDDTFHRLDTDGSHRAFALDSFSVEPDAIDAALAHVEETA